MNEIISTIDTNVPAFRPISNFNYHKIKLLPVHHRGKHLRPTGNYTYLQKKKRNLLTLFHN